MEGMILKIYTFEFQKHHGILVYHWLLETAHRMKIPGGSVFRGIAGYGRHGEKLDEHFFELASNVPFEVCFVAKKEDAKKLITVIKKEKIDVLIVTHPAEFEWGNNEQTI